MAATGRTTAAFVQRLRELGWIEGRTVAIEYRWAEGPSERYAESAAELVRLKVDVIVTAGGAVVAVKQATSVIRRVSCASLRHTPARAAISTSPENAIAVNKRQRVPLRRHVDE